MTARRDRLQSGRIVTPFRHQPSASVLAARAKRGRTLDTKIDKCKTCLHFLPPNYCPKDRGYTTAEGSCALHDAAVSEIDHEQ